MDGWQIRRVEGLYDSGEQRGRRGVEQRVGTAGERVSGGDARDLS